MPFDHNYDDVREQLLEHSKNHEITILRDDGEYRHIRIAEPGTGMWSWNLITWPGWLAITGDIGNGYMFTRLSDMFKFFRSASGGINPSYWAEKMPNSITAQVYEQEILEDYVAGWATEGREDMDPAERAEFTSALQRDVYEQLSGHEQSDRDVLEAFRYKRRDGYVLSFSEVWEISARAYDHSLILAMNAIVKGIQMYDAHKTAEALRNAPVEAPELDGYRIQLSDEAKTDFGTAFPTLQAAVDRIEANQEGMRVGSDPRWMAPKVIVKRSRDGGPWTRHGHLIPGVTLDGPGRPPVARCGGPGLCRYCSADAAFVRNVNGVEAEDE